MPKIPQAATETLDGIVKVRVTKFGAGKISTGEHVAVAGDTKAKAGDVLDVSPRTARSLEQRGLAEIA
ncbi:MAG: hypothetical protein ACREFW_06830 [Rhizomicrobium sp.]